MSYILDALKKAEAERHIGQVPGLHVQPAAALPHSAPQIRSNKWLIAIAAALLGIGGALAWIQPWKSQLAQARQATVAPSSLAAPASDPSSPTPAATPATPAAQVIAITAPPEPPAPAPRTAEKPRPPVTPRPREATKPAATATAKASAAQPAAVAGASAVEAPASDLKISTALTPETGALSPGELPEQIQRELPTLAIGGYIYSDNPRERQLLVNKRLLHEGAEAAPGVRLEKMLPNAAVFNYKGYRYRLSY